MSVVVVRVECDTPGCEAHVEVSVKDAARTGGAELVALHESSPRAFWLEVLLDLPEDWRCEGGGMGDGEFRALCGTHS